ncbi:MAG TPA: ATPase [Cyanobacteria bacterium UBA8553]|nr:ATPase [Cyanobacteria bacterium UBA8553]HAJ60180.1 ATPase [Cyanobacteria bacterium UBA8543]
MLKKLILENWKSFRYAELPIDPLTVLIGTNASGKSNAIEALEFLRRTVIGKEIKAALVGDSTLSSIRGGLEWASRKPEPFFTLKVLVQGEDDSIDYHYSITVRTVRRFEVLSESLECIKQNHSNTKPEIFFLFNTAEVSPKSVDNPGIIVYFDIKENTRVYQEFRRFTSILSQLNTFSLPQNIVSNQENLLSLPQEAIEGIRLVSQILQNIFVLDSIPYKMRNYSPISENIERDASNIAGVLAGLPNEQKAEFESTVSAYVKHLPERDIQRVWAEPVGRFGNDAMLYCEEQWNRSEKIEIDARGMSDGTLRFLAILTALLTRPEGSQLVIEEVDNGLHPSRVDLLLRMLKEIGQKRKIDILVTTHNPALLDALDPEMIPFVVVAHRDTETGESKLTLLEDVENLPKLIASGSLGRITTKGAIERSLSDHR